MKPRVRIPEEVELAIFSRLQAKESPTKIARAVGCSLRSVQRLRQLGRPRWRHRAHGQIYPSEAVIRWHCDQFKFGWTKIEERQRRVAKPVELVFQAISESLLGLPKGESLWNLREESE